MSQDFKNIFGRLVHHTKYQSDKIAIICNEEQITYGQLCQRVTRLSQKMQQLGVSRQQMVATYLPRSIDLVVAMLAIFKLGAIFVPLALNVSKKKNQQKINQGQIDVLISYSTDMLINDAMLHINIKEYSNLSTSLNDNKYPTTLSYKAGDIAYILFTSGTTGIAKGVKITYQALNNHLLWKSACYPVSKDAIELQKVPLSFDVAIRELLGWVFSGSSLCIIQEGDEANPSIICHTIETHKCEELSIVPCLLNAFLGYIDAFNVTSKLASLKRVIVGGEVLTSSTVNNFKKIFKHHNIELINAYGPTEATIEVTHFNCNDLIFSNKDMVPIGKPIYPESLYICNKDNQIVQPGEIGELHIRGTQVAKGYMKSSAAQNEQFYFHNATSRQSYKTGDLVRLDDNGYLYYHGRIDEQIKVNGHRFELQEIQQAFEGLIPIASVAITYEKSAGNHIITAYILNSAFDDTPLSQTQILQHLTLSLDSYFIPKQLFMIKGFSYLDSGKIDKTNLKTLIEPWPSFTYKPQNKEIKSSRNLSIIEVFEHSVYLQPNKIAIYDADESITYQQLNNRINKIARVLHHDFNVKKDTLIAIFMKPGINWLVCVLAILKASGAYMPLSLNAPALRNQNCIDDAQASLLITDDENAEQLVAKQICFDSLLFKEKYDTKKEQSLYNNLNIPRSSNSLFTVLFTSGSTGRPKGVMLEDSGIYSRLAHKQQIHPIKDHQNTLLMNEISFDAAIFELFSWIYASNSLVIMPVDKCADPQSICNYAQKYKIAELILAPSLLHAILNYIKHHGLTKNLESLTSVRSVGDILRSDIVALFDQLLHQPFGVLLINGYGPSEASIEVCEFVVPTAEGLSNIPLGKAPATNELVILNRNNHPSPKGEQGQIAISGIGLARGYINNPELTAKSFILNPNMPNNRLYLTGDLGYIDKQGLLKFCGREDHQVKIHGHRVELIEIEQAIHHFIPSNQVVITTEYINKDNNLVAYIERRALKKIGLTLDVLRKKILKILPHYLIPRLFHIIDKIPLNSNGKVDRHSLPDLVKNKNKVSAKNHENKLLLEIIQSEFSLSFLPNLDDSLMEYGADSISIIHLISEIKRQLNWDISLDKVNISSTIQHLKECQEKEEVACFTNLFITYNTQQYKTIYCFPPASSFGFAYHKLAQELNDFRLICYHFPENSDDVINLYCKHIISHSNNKNITLVGYSGGGNLAIAVAHKLESQGKTVDQIIMFDAFKLRDKLTKLPDSILLLQQKMIESTIKELAKNGLKQHTIRSKVMRYYTHHWLVQPAIKTAIKANIITLDSQQADMVKQLTEDPVMKAVFVPSWEKSTNGKLISLEGYGIHNEMLQPPHVQKNINLLKPYLLDNHSGICSMPDSKNKNQGVNI